MEGTTSLLEAKKVLTHQLGRNLYARLDAISEPGVVWTDVNGLSFLAREEGIIVSVTEVE